MTKRRPSNKKPVGVNRSLGNALAREREVARKAHRQSRFNDGDQENPAFIEAAPTAKNISSVIDESSLEEFLAKAELAGTEFAAEKGEVSIVNKESSMVVPRAIDFANSLELQKKFEDRLKIPRRPAKELWETADDLNKLENEVFLKWRSDLSELQEENGLTITPFEKNPEMWRELWRVVERSDILVQIVDARNPLLFRSHDLETYVKEVDPAKQTVLLVNKADLLTEAQIALWRQYFEHSGISVIFWSALSKESGTDEKIEEEDEDEGNVEEQEEGPSGSDQQKAHTEEHNDNIVNGPDELVETFKKMGGVRGEPGERALVVGMVGYPNVGKSSTINKIVGRKRVSVSATPGKTKRLQTIPVDDHLILCDCPGLVMPSFTFGRNEMFLNGIIPVSQLREPFGPTSLLLSRVPSWYFERFYSLMLPPRDEAHSQPTAKDLLSSLAFLRGFMSSSGIPDCSRAGRLLLSDVVDGRLCWASAPPSVDQEDYNRLLFGTEEDALAERKGGAQLKQLESRGLLESNVCKGQRVDDAFFGENVSGAHVKDVHVRAPAQDKGDKKHHNRNKKEKLRRVYCGSSA